jgi:hypothetical protein
LPVKSKWISVCLFSAALCLVFPASGARACDFFYASVTEGNCASCHGAPPNTTITCNGCHKHGAHDSGDNMNLRATTRQRYYSPGQMVKVVLMGGYRSGWARTLLYDHDGNEVARNTGTVKTGAVAPSGGTGLPGYLNAPAPIEPGTYTWTAAWYGNKFDDPGVYTKFGRWVPDAGNPNHGYELVDATIVVTDNLAPLLVVAPASPATLTLAATPVGGSASSAFTLSNYGNIDLHVASLALCAGSSPEFSTATAAPFTILPGTSQPVTVSYTPSGIGTDNGCFRITTDDPAASESLVNVSGTGTQGTDLDVASFTATAKVSLARKQAVAINLTIRNYGTVTTYNSIATVVGKVGTAEVYRQTLNVYDAAGDTLATAFPFPAYQPTAVGTINWSVTVTDADPDVDARTATTTVTK